MKLIPQELLDKLEYRDGELYWKSTSKFSNRKIGERAGSLQKDFYRSIKYKKIKYQEHRVIFFMFNKYLPEVIDHINGNPSDNRIENLRESTWGDNSKNMAMRKSNKSGHKNVSFHTASKKWCVSMNVDGIPKWFGSYHDIDYAIFVATAMRHKYHGKFARHQ